MGVGEPGCSTTCEPPFGAGRLLRFRCRARHRKRRVAPRGQPPGADDQPSAVALAHTTTVAHDVPDRRALHGSETATIVTPTPAVARAQSRESLGEHGEEDEPARTGPPARSTSARARAAPTCKPHATTATNPTDQNHFERKRSAALPSGWGPGSAVRAPRRDVSTERRGWVASAEARRESNPRDHEERRLETRVRRGPGLAGRAIFPVSIG